METINIEVKSKGELLGETTCKKYVSLDEALADGVTQDYARDSINRCLHKDARDKFYADKTTTPSLAAQAKRISNNLEGDRKAAFDAEMAKLMAKFAK